MKKRDQWPAYYPVSLNIDSQKCVVVGGGQVALRKVRTLLEHRANVEVISPDLCSGLSQLAESGGIRYCHREYQAGDLKDAFLVIVATNNRQTNLKIAGEARSNAVLVNVVDDPENSDFIVPSYLRRGDVTLAISTGGRSPALARKIRTRLEEDFGNEYASLALLIDEVRAELKQQGIKVNGDAWQEALDLDRLLGLLRRGDNKKARAVLVSNLKGQRK